jgi:hypothetical protein
VTYTRAQLDDAERRIEEMFTSERQLSAALHQAEGYRNFMGSLTGLLTAVFILKGQGDLSKLGGCPRWTVVSLLITGLLTLIAATWLGVLATHGRPGEEFLGEPNRLLDHEAARTRRIWVLIEWARWLALTGVLCVAAGVIVTWVAPGK